jgi:copper chaperone CopZ
MHTQTYNVKGMHCASCSSVIEKTFKKVEGVHSAEVNYGTERAKVSFDPSKTNPHDLSGYIEKLGYSLEIPTTAEEMGMSEVSTPTHLGLNQSKKKSLLILVICGRKYFLQFHWQFCHLRYGVGYSL